MRSWWGSFLFLYMFCIFPGLAQINENYRFQLGITKQFQQDYLIQSAKEDLELSGEQVGATLGLSYLNRDQTYLHSELTLLNGEATSRYYYNKKNHSGKVEQRNLQFEVVIGKNSSSSKLWEVIPFLGVRVEEDHRTFNYNRANGELKGISFDITQRHYWALMGMIIKHQLSSTLSLGGEVTAGKMVQKEESKKGQYSADQKMELSRQDILVRAKGDATLSLDSQNSFLLTPFIDKRMQKGGGFVQRYTQNYGASVSFLYKF